MMANIKYCCSLAAVKSAMGRIRPYVHRTPLMTSQTLNKLTGHKIFLKAENLQKTGSFKFRGAMNAVLNVKQGSPQTDCVVTDSSGNHGQALAHAAQNAGIDCYVVMPENSAKCKIDSVRGYGATVLLCEPSEKGRKDGAENACEKHNGVYVSASQHPDVISGQGTIGMEILEQNADIDVIIAAVGGGGLISGIATAIKESKPNIKIVGAEPELANDCYISKKSGVLTPNKTFPKTIADGVKVSVGANTWPMVRDLVDDVITVAEDEIKKATLLTMERCKLVIEPTAGVAVAAILSDKLNDCLRGLFGDDGPKKIAVVICGGNIDFSAFSKLLS